MTDKTKSSLPEGATGTTRCECGHPLHEDRCREVDGTLILGTLRPCLCEKSASIPPSVMAVEALLRKHAAMYDWKPREEAAINDFILTIRFGVAEDLASLTARVDAAERAAAPFDGHMCREGHREIRWTGDGECPVCEALYANVDASAKVKP